MGFMADHDFYPGIPGPCLVQPLHHISSDLCLWSKLNRNSMIQASPQPWLTEEVFHMRNHCCAFEAFLDLEG